MFSRVRYSKWATGPLSAFIIAAMCGNALAVLFCPHMSGGKCCFTDSSHLHSHSTTADTAASTGNMHVQHEQMSDMDMEDGSMEMEASQSPVIGSSEKIRIDFAKGNPSQTTPDQAAVTETDGPCSHCMMHSRSSERFSTSVVENNNSNHLIPRPGSGAAAGIVPSVHAIVELHDHSPPGLIAPLYVLVSSFRI